MKTLIIVLILTAFLQATIIPVDLVLLILILRAFVKSQNLNLVLSFGMGLLVSLLTFSLFGVYSLIYLFLIELVDIFIARTNLIDNILVVPILSFFTLISENLILSLFIHRSIELNLAAVLWGTVLSIPIYLILRFWEERFVVRDIKLKF